MGVESEYDVDNSVQVYEEISGNPIANTMTDNREVTGGGKKELTQTFFSNGLAGISDIKGDSGSVQSSLFLAANYLTASQSSSMGGAFAHSYLAGWQKYLGQDAFTAQYTGVASGNLKTSQFLSLGPSIYSTQSYQASGQYPLALGIAMLKSQGSNDFSGQGAVIASGSCREGSISGQMGAEIVVVPEEEYVIDPVAYGSHMTAQGDVGAGIIAAAGSLQGSLKADENPVTVDLKGQGALAGAVAAGNGQVSVDYIEAWTDGQKSGAYEEDAEAEGGEFAAVGAAAGSLDSRLSLGADTYSRLSGQGALTGAVAGGEDSFASADYTGAQTDGRETFSWGHDVHAEGDSLAAVASVSGSFRKVRAIGPNWPFMYSDSQFALAGTMGTGRDSSASAAYLRSFADGNQASAQGWFLEAEGRRAAQAMAASGEWLDIDDDELEVQDGSVTGLTAEKNAKVRAELLSASSGHGASSSGWGLAARGDRSAMTYSASGDEIEIEPDEVGVEHGTLTAAAAEGKHSTVRADWLKSIQAGQFSASYGDDLEAMGSDTVVATASGHDIEVKGHEAEVEDGTVTAAAVEGRHSAVRADWLKSLQSSQFSASSGDYLEAKGSETVVATASGHDIEVKGHEAEVEDGTVTAAAAEGRRSAVRADWLKSIQSGQLSASSGDYLEAMGSETVVATASGHDIEVKGHEAEVEDGTVTAAAAEGWDSAAWARELSSSQAGQLSTSDGEYLLAEGREATVASASGHDIEVKSDEAGAQQGSITGVSANGMAEAFSSSMGAGNGAVGYSYALDLGANGKESAVAASADGKDAFLRSDSHIALAHVEDGTLTGVSACEDAMASSYFLGSADWQDIRTSAGANLRASGVQSASGASGVGDEVVLLSNDEKGKAKVEGGGIFATAARGGASVDAGMMGSIDLGIGKGWIGLLTKADGDKSATGTGSGHEVIVEADAARVQATAGSAIGATAFGPGAQTGASGMGGFGEGLASTLMATNVQAQGLAASAGAGAGVNVAIQSDGSSSSVEATAGYVDGLTAFGNGLVTAEALNVETALPSGTNLYARGEKALGASAVGAYVRMQSGTDVNRVEVSIGSMTGLAAEGGYVSAGSMSEDGTASGTNVKSSGTKSSAASATGASAVLESGKISVTAGSAVGMVSKDGQVGANSLGFGSGNPSGSVLIASGRESTLGSSSGGIITMKSDGISTEFGSVVGASASNSNGGAKVSSSILSAGSVGASGSILTAENADNAIIAAISGATADLKPTSAAMIAGTLIGVGAISLGATGDLHADSLTASYTGSSAASGSGLKSMAGTSAMLGASGTLTFKPSASNGIDSGALFAEAGGKTTTPGNSLSSGALQSSYQIAGILSVNRNVNGLITADGSSSTRFVFAGYDGDKTKRYKNSPGSYSVSSFYNTNPFVSSGASITP